MHDATPCSREDSLCECRPCDALTCLFFAMASAKPMQIGAGHSVSEGYRPEVLHGDPDQSRSMIACRAHILGLACRSVSKIRSFQTFAFS